MGSGVPSCEWSMTQMLIFSWFPNPQGNIQFFQNNFFPRENVLSGIREDMEYTEFSKLFAFSLYKLSEQSQTVCVAKQWKCDSFVMDRGGIYTLQLGCNTFLLRYFLMKKIHHFCVTQSVMKNTTPACLFELAGCFSSFWFAVLCKHFL